MLCVKRIFSKINKSEILKKINELLKYFYKILIFRVTSTQDFQ